MLSFFNNDLTVEEYITLKEKLGFRVPSESQVEKLIQRSLFITTVREEDKLVGFGRMIGDGMNFVIYDVLIDSDFQKRGLGTAIVNRLVNFAKDEVEIGEKGNIFLVPLMGKETFYDKLGFKRLPNSLSGCGMRMNI